MKFIDDLPFYFTIIGVIINIVIGIATNISFTALMLRSIAVTIVFALVGMFLSYTLKDVLKSSKKSDSGVNTSKSSLKETEITSTFDVSVPPIDENELLNYDLNEDEFIEVSPAYLHTLEQEDEKLKSLL